MDNRIFQKFNLSHLKYFFDAAEFGSVSLSAEKNCITQSSVSQAIKKIEDTLDVTLVEHKRNSFYLTKEGEFFFDKLRPLMLEVQKLEEFSCFKNRLIGPLELVTTSGLATTYMQDKIIEFKKKYPEIKINVKISRPDKIAESIKLQKSEIGFLLNNLDTSDFHVHKLGEGDFVAVKNKNYKGSFVDSEFILSGNLPETRLFKNQFLNTYKKDMKVAIIFESWNGIANYLCHANGIGLLPDYILKSEQYRSKLSVIKTSLYKPSYEIIAITNKSRTISRVNKEFLSFFCVNK